jgi:uncharacterized protein (DUF1810 family)
LALKQTPIDKFLYLSTLRKNNVHLFYRLVTDHLRVCPEALPDAAHASAETCMGAPH